MKKISTLLLIILSYNSGYSYFSLDPNILEYGNLKFNKTLSGSDDVLSDSAVVLNEGDVMIILRFTTDRTRAAFGNQYDSYSRGGIYVYTKNTTDDEILTPVNTNGYSLFVTSPPDRTSLSAYLQGTYIVGPKIVCIAWPNFATSGGFYGPDQTIKCEMDYAIQRKRIVNPQPVSQ